MCGIFAYLGTTIDSNELEKNFLKIQNRGPDNHELKAISSNVIFGFHRLAINDTSFK